MTRAPANLLAVRSLLLEHLNRDPNRARDEDLEPNEVGIVGDANHRGGYHCGSNRVVTNDYSVVESSRDRNGLTLDAAALDVGLFRVSSDGRDHNLFTFSAWCVAQCVANAPDTRDIREIIYSPDGTVVRRWDRLGRRSTGDRSHLWHTHFSFFRDSIKANRDQRPLFRRYLSAIGLVKLEEENDMTPEEHNWLETVHRNLTVLDGRNPVGQIYTRMAMGEDHIDPKFVVGHPTLRTLGAQLTAMQTALKSLGNRDVADEQAIITGVLAGLTPQEIAAAIPPTVADQVVTELSRRLAA
ncbi:hypothetical protein SAMN05443287_11297 [Micromonospora phaseoli]|uniref:Uncharacterized protein n=1 Tax=Micromonospora phaseoli TaxID=1144548 RepID=A0A1H7D9S4_9ACTN|nr:hypothetical protein [Micromonospora phaseoli]PZV90876.1 hypothetical protein CLV64_11298 [Micromonospora phaseoli]GIJ77456.1 hypothetical protein Xph01_18880 [Micromonospora phaseoli]SEJ98084.1 hypothetical protein SAMN05443287_11297 [Micromonospora phaseoli]